MKFLEDIKGNYISEECSVRISRGLASLFPPRLGWKVSVKWHKVGRTDVVAVFESQEDSWKCAEHVANGLAKEDVSVVPYPRY